MPMDEQFDNTCISPEGIKALIDH